MKTPRVTVIVPTLAVDSIYRECLAALKLQSFRDFDCIVVDNSGQRRVGGDIVTEPWVRVIFEDRNTGFGGAVNHAATLSGAEFIVTLNDDAIPAPQWLDALVCEAGADPEVGMCASKIRLKSTGMMDSAGMLLSGDGSSKQDGHGLAPESFTESADALLPSACAALYRRNMLAQIGFFDEEFFLYCEDTDLGLRAQWAGWKCRFVAGAEVEHRYSHSAGRASPLKAYYVERNRIAVALKNLPLAMLWKVPFVSALRYFWHVVYMLSARGAAAQYRHGGGGALDLVWFTLRAHLSALANLPSYWKKRIRIRRDARIGAREFAAIARRHSISARQVAAL